MTQLLALHGFTGAPASFEGLAERHPGLALLCPALCGHGPAADLSASDFDAELERLATWTRARARGPLPVLGYSLGARVALGLCLAHPELFSKAVLIGVNPGLDEAGERAERARWEAEWIDLLERRGLPAFLERWEGLPLFASQAALSPSVREQQRRIRASHEPRGLAHALRVLGTGSMPSYFAKLRELTMPVLLVVGEKDTKFRALAERALAALPHGQLAVLEGSGHNPLLEAPEALSAALDAFLAPPRALAASRSASS